MCAKIELGKLNEHTWSTFHTQLSTDVRCCKSLYTLIDIHARCKRILIYKRAVTDPLDRLYKSLRKR